VRLLRIAPIAVLFMLGAAGTAVAATGSAADPSCAQGPATVGETTFGTPCDDVIRVPPAVASVHGGGGDDLIVPTPITALAECPLDCFLGIGSQTFDGGPGDDIVFGQRGNDKLNGGEGNDRLYGGIGDDLLRGGPGNDLLSGGFGFDVIDGEAGDDFVRGDATVDEIADSGGGFDTLSYATGVTPGFTRNPGVVGFPASSGERGVYVDLGDELGDNGVAPFGGGVDEIEAGSFEKVIGTPYSDYIAGSDAAETLDGGGGADALFGNSGNDILRGGADRDLLDGGDGDDNLEPGAEDSGSGIVLRDQMKVSVGLSAAEETTRPQLYLTGSLTDDKVTASYSSGPPRVTFVLGPGSQSTFDASLSANAGCDVLEPGKAECPLAASPDSLILAGLGGNDALTVSGFFPAATYIVLSGGDGGDSLSGGDANEDVLVDGPGGGIDSLAALGGDDALLHNGGADTRLGGNGNDLFLSDSICDNDLLNGGNDRDNASWSKFGPLGVEANLSLGIAGGPGAGDVPDCGGESVDHLQEIEDLEGTSQEDFFYGSSGDNQLLGRPGKDSYFALDGKDSILANSGDSDAVIDCGGGDEDSALIDFPTAKYEDPVPIDCETVNNAEVNSFEPPAVLPSTPPPPPKATPAATRDRKPPGTRFTHRPPKVIATSSRRRRLAFAFAANESGASFRCKLDRAPFKPCRSPRIYTVRLGLHAVRVFAIDAAGNRDRTPALFKFRLRRRLEPLSK
jgi:Ca2+-binding RTX toxin-like protein